jgi:hypothetical protein
VGGVSAATTTGAGGWVRRGGLALVMVGALSVSVRGQVQAVEPLLGPMSVVLALTNDLAALLALNELMSTRRREVRRWAWAVLLLAGGTAAGLNTWHAVAAHMLPAVWAVVVGIGPVLLAVVLSHLVALVLDQTATPAGVAAAAAPVEQNSTVRPPRAAAPVTTAAVVESSRAGQVAQALTGPGIHHGLAAVPAAVRPARAPAAATVSAGRGSGGVDARVAQLAAQLHAGADLTGAQVAEQLGCSERTGRRLLRQAQDHPAQDHPAPAAGGEPGERRGTG